MVFRSAKFCASLQLFWRKKSGLNAHFLILYAYTFAAAATSVQKFLKEVTLLSQVFVKDDKFTIESLLKSRNASVASFTMYTVGEGIEKAVVDYAAEVAAAAKV